MENKEEITVWVVYSESRVYPEVFEDKIEALEYANYQNKITPLRKYMVIDRVIR